MIPPETPDEVEVEVEVVDLEGPFPSFREKSVKPPARNAGPVAHEPIPTRAVEGLDLDKITFATLWHSMTLPHVATVTAFVFGLLTTGWWLGGERVQYIADKDVHEVLEREKDEQAATRTCQYDLNATKQQLDAQKQQFDRDQTNAELEKKRQLEKAASQCEVAPSMHKGRAK